VNPSRYTGSAMEGDSDDYCVEGGVGIRGKCFCVFVGRDWLQVEHPPSPMQGLVRSCLSEGGSVFRYSRCIAGREVRHVTEGTNRKIERQRCLERFNISTETATILASYLFSSPLSLSFTAHRSIMHLHQSISLHATVPNTSK